MAVIYVTSNAPNVTVCYLDALVMRGVWKSRSHERPRMPESSNETRAQHRAASTPVIAPHSGYKFVVRETEFISMRSGHHRVPVILRRALVIDTGAKTEGLDL
jgi:hypothetical protein